MTLNLTQRRNSKSAVGVGPKMSDSPNASSIPNENRNIQPPDFSSPDSEMYDDSCDFGQFMLNPCLCMFNFTISLAKRCSLKSTIKRIEKCDEVATANMQWFIYIVAVFGSWTIVFLQVYPLCTESRHLANYHKTIGCFVFVFCVGSWRFACGIDPGNITEQTMARFDHYPYDDFLYTDTTCPTLKIRKLARSKYDKYTDRHIPRFDHYCGWLAQPIGEENYRWFLWFLLVHVGMCIYGALMLYILLRGEVMDEPGLLLTVLVHVLWERIWIAAAFLLMCAVSAVLGAFVVFHVWLTAAGMTTNEYYKWREIKSWHRETTKGYQEALKSGVIKADGGTTLSSSRAASGMTYHRIISRKGPPLEKDEEKNATATTSSNNNIILNPGPMKNNIYNRGMASNFGEVLFPLSKRKERQKDL